MVIDYRKSGVNREAGDELVDWIKGSSFDSKDETQKSLKKSIVSGIGGFASINAFHFPNFKEPCIVTSTDGVGTKVKLASYYSDFSTIGKDLVAMCLNDLITTGAEPWLFLDYYATGQLKLDHAKQFLESVRNACIEGECLLVGGETAEMPGVYANNDMDCAGFAVGVVDRPKIFGSHRVKKNDCLIGVSSSGFHSNGYSLVRKVFSDQLAEMKTELLKPTHLYVKLVKALRKIEGVNAFVNVTGSGVENYPRSIPENLMVKFNKWEIPALFLALQAKAKCSTEELLKTLNCGVGFAVVSSPETASLVMQTVESSGFEGFKIGEILDKTAASDIDLNCWY